MGGLVDTDKARNIIKEISKPEFSNYIQNELAGDFANALANNINEIKLKTIQECLGAIMFHEPYSVHLIADIEKLIDKLKWKN